MNPRKKKTRVFLKGKMPKEREMPTPEREYIDENEFYHLIYRLISSLLEQAGMFEGRANQMLAQAEHLKNTLEAIELAKQTGHRIKYFTDEDGGFGYMPIKKQSIGFNHEQP